MSDRDLPGNGGWKSAESWVRDDIRRLEEKVDALADEMAESRGRWKTWHVFVFAGITLFGGGAIGVTIRTPALDEAKQIESLRDVVMQQQKDIDRILRAEDRR